MPTGFPKTGSARDRFAGQPDVAVFELAELSHDRLGPAVGRRSHLAPRLLLGIVDAAAGCSELEIRAISGHSMKALPGALGSYIDAWKSLAEAAVRKRENARRTKKRKLTKVQTKNDSQ